MPRPRFDKYAEGREVLETVLEAYGEEALLEFIKHRVLDTKTLTEVGDELMVPFPVLWEWMSDEMDRLKVYESALKGLSDQIVHGMMQVANDSGDAKIKLEAIKWLSSRWDRARFGENIKHEVVASESLISLLSSLKDLPQGELIEGEVIDIQEPKRIVEVVPLGTGSEVPKENS